MRHIRWKIFKLIPYRSNMVNKPVHYIPFSQEKDQLSTQGIAPALLRLLFHDCFVQGCDASVLLDADAKMDSEKQSPPNVGLKGYDVVDIIKGRLEDACPGIVSCADIIAVSARDGVVLAGGQFYPVVTGRRDSTIAFPKMPLAELPFPNSNLSDALALFRSQNFDEGETVSLLGAGHSIGRIHCHFFKDRLHNFNGTGEVDPTMDREFVDQLRAECSGTNNSSDSDPAKKMDYEGPGVAFGTLYYRSLLQGRGLLFVDQQLMARNITADWVRAYASDASLFQFDFGKAMFKLSNLNVLTAPSGEVRLSCSKKNS